MIPLRYITKERPIFCLICGHIRRFVITEIRDGMVTVKRTGPKTDKARWTVSIKFVQVKCDLRPRTLKEFIQSERAK